MRGVFLERRLVRLGDDHLDARECVPSDYVVEVVLVGVVRGELDLDTERSVVSVQVIRVFDRICLAGDFDLEAGEVLLCPRFLSRLGLSSFVLPELVEPFLGDLVRRASLGSR